MLKNQDSYLQKEADRPDRTMSHQKVNVGDIVYYFSRRAQPGVPGKLQRKWIGPYKVTRIVSPSLVILHPTLKDKDDRYTIPAVVNRISLSLIHI